VLPLIKDLSALDRPEGFAQIYRVWQHAFEHYNNGAYDPSGIRRRVLALLKDHLQISVAQIIVRLNAERCPEDPGLNPGVFLLLKAGYFHLFLVQLRNLTSGRHLYGNLGEYSLPALLKDIRRDRADFTRAFVARYDGLSRGNKDWLLQHAETGPGVSQLLSEARLARMRQGLKVFEPVNEKINKYLTHVATPESRGDVRQVELAPGEADACLKELVRLTQELSSFVFGVNQLQPDELDLPDLSHLSHWLLQDGDLPRFEAEVTRRLEEMQGWLVRPEALSG